MEIRPGFVTTTELTRMVTIVADDAKADVHFEAAFAADAIGFAVPADHLPSTAAAIEVGIVVKAGVQVDTTVHRAQTGGRICG